MIRVFALFAALGLLSACQSLIFLRAAKPRIEVEQKPEQEQEKEPVLNIAKLILRGKAKKYFLVGMNKELMEFRGDNLAIFFEPGTFEGFFLEKTASGCLIHRLSIYDMNADGEYDSVYLDRHLFYKSRFLQGGISFPIDFTEAEAYLFIDMANVLVGEYKQVFSDKGIDIAYLNDVKTVHDLAESFYYYEADAMYCQYYSGKPDIGLMQKFFPASNLGGR